MTVCDFTPDAYAHEAELGAPLTQRLIALIHECEQGLPRDWRNLDALRSAMKG